MKTTTVEYSWKKMLIAGAAVLALAGGGAVFTNEMNADAATSDSSQEQKADKTAQKEKGGEHRKGKHGHEGKHKNLEAADPSTIKISQDSALKTFATETNNAQLSELEIEFEKDKYVYELEGFDGKQEYKVEINAKTGEVISKQAETMDDEDKAENKALDLSKVINKEEASKIAQQKVGSGTSKQWELEQKDDGTAVWKVAVADGTKVSRVRINAVTKEVLASKEEGTSKSDKTSGKTDTTTKKTDKSTASTSKKTTSTTKKATETTASK